MRYLEASYEQGLTQPSTITSSTCAASSVSLSSTLFDPRSGSSSSQAISTGSISPSTGFTRLPSASPPTRSFPPGVFPTGLFPTGVFPSGVFPPSVDPTGASSAGGFLTGFFPTQPGSPTRVFPTGTGFHSTTAAFSSPYRWSNSSSTYRSTASSWSSSWLSSSLSISSWPSPSSFLSWEWPSSSSSYAALPTYARSSSYAALPTYGRKDRRQEDFFYTPRCLRKYSITYGLDGITSACDCLAVETPATTIVTKTAVDPSTTATFTSITEVSSRRLEARCMKPCDSPSTGCRHDHDYANAHYDYI